MGIVRIRGNINDSIRFKGDKGGSLQFDAPSKTYNYSPEFFAQTIYSAQQLHSEVTYEPWAIWQLTGATYNVLPDTSGNGHNMTLSGSTNNAYVNPGWGPGGTSFGGFLDTPPYGSVRINRTEEDMSFFTGAISIYFLIYAFNITIDRGFVEIRDTGNLDLYFNLGLEARGIQTGPIVGDFGCAPIYTYKDSAGTEIEHQMSESVIQRYEWAWLGMTRDETGTSIKTYINGVFSEEITAATAPRVSAGATTFVVYIPEINEFQGALQSVKIVPRELTAAEMESEYLTTIGVTGNLVPPSI